jgi:hypothetical protein
MAKLTANVLPDNDGCLVLAGGFRLCVRPVNAGDGVEEVHLFEENAENERQSADLEELVKWMDYAPLAAWLRAAWPHLLAHNYSLAASVQVG